MPSATTFQQVTNPSHDDDVDAYSIPEFCRRHGICRGTYYHMKANRTAPREFRAMGRVLISKEEATRWRESATIKADADRRLDGVAA
jgi:hypothetical protein